VIGAEVAGLSARQHAQIARRQLYDLGLSNRAIRYRVRCGIFFESFPGVFSVGHPPTSPHAWAAAAVLACGEGAVLSYESAAALWKMLPRLDRPFHVTAKADRHIPGIEVHRAQVLKPQDTTVQLGIPTTSPARTALDIATCLNHKALTRAVNDGRHAGFLHAGALKDIVERSKGHRGVKALRELALPAQRQAPTRSQFEDDFLAFAKRYRLPTPLVNVKVAGHVVDAYFPDHKLVVELDGWEFHNDRAAFNNDRDRDADLLAIEHATVRITSERLDHTPAQEAARLKTIMTRRAPQVARPRRTP
jgi:very-short-patch-repair endonuclease